MIIQIDISDQWDTLHTFAQTGPQMARHHLHIPDATMAEVEDLCARYCMTKSKFIVRGVQLALDDARKRFGEPANDPVAVTFVPTKATAPRSTPVAVAKEQEVSTWPDTVLRGDTVWFELSAVCNELDIAMPELMAEIDPEDDVLEYAGRQWVDGTAMKEAKDLCQQPNPAFWAWYESRLASTP